MPAAGPSGEGTYAIVRQGGRATLTYVLRLPEEPGQAQRDLPLQKKGAYVLSVKDPGVASPRARAWTARGNPTCRAT